jgi:hypothetical protein
MTPYQRGGRDALLALAAEIEAQADQEQAATPLGDAYVVGSAKHQAVIASRWRTSTMRNNATLARRRAEALPHDPEEEPACPV